VPQFAQSYGGIILPYIASTSIGDITEKILKSQFGSLSGWVPVLRMLQEMRTITEDETKETNANINPMCYFNNVNERRRVRFLVGENDPLLKVADAKACAARFKNGDCYAVPGLGHGTSKSGPNFEQHVNYYLQTQLSDWSW